MLKQILEFMKTPKFLNILVKSKTILAGTATCIGGAVLIISGKIAEGVSMVLAGVGIIEGRKATARVDAKLNPDEKQG